MRSAQQEGKLGTQSLTRRFMRRAQRADGLLFIYLFLNQSIPKALCQLDLTEYLSLGRPFVLRHRWAIAPR